MRISILVVLLLWASSVFARPTKVACVGNSVTYGYLLENRERDCYPAQLARLLGEGYEVRNFGKSGATLLNKGHRPYMQQQEFRDAVDFAADIVVIHLGLNDTDPRNWLNYRDEFVRDYLQLIDTFRVANPDCRVWICRMTPITNGHFRFKSGTRDWYEQIQNAIEHVARVAEVPLIDLQEGLYNRPDLLPDALHPVVEGAGIIARKVYSAVTGDYGGLQMPAVYGDNMVLQRGRALTLKGTANGGEEVTVKIGKQRKKAVTGMDGCWQVVLEPLEAGGPYELSVKTVGKSLVFKNVLVGEVWLCSGQSNMAFMVKQAAGAKETLAGAANDRIRLYNMKPRVYTDMVSWDTTDLQLLNRLEHYLPTSWASASSESVAEFSAVAYYFGKMLADSLKVPVGLICNAIGGAPAEAFIDRKTMEFDPVLVDELYDWTKNDMLQDWVRGRALLNMKNTTSKYQRHSYEPSYLYVTGVLPLAGFPVNGFIWYQGESNAHNVELHEYVFPALVKSWRNTWGEELPFYYVQLSSINRPSWPHFRDSQRRLAGKMTNVAMVVSSDLGNRTDVHPVRKREVGERLARWALHRDYGFKEVVPSGPLYRGVEFRDGAAFVAFDYGEGMKASDGQALRTFEIAGEDRLFVPANAEVVGNEVKVSSPRVKNPKYVRYGWEPYSTGNLVNEEGLPASTFRNEGEIF